MEYYSEYSVFLVGTIVDCAIKLELAKYYKDSKMTALISERSRNSKYRVFFIERQIRISYKMLKISLFHVGSGLRTEVTMGNLISDQFKTNF